MRRTVKRHYKKRRTLRKMSGKGEIGRGDAARVYRPPVNCDPPFITENNKDNYISKVFSYNANRAGDTAEYTTGTADKEIEAAKLIREKIPDTDDFILLPIHRCKNITNSKNTLIYNYGGKSIIQYYHSNISNSLKNKIIKSLINLYPYIIKLHKENIYHNDIYNSNIVYNEETGRSYLIDLEKVRNIDLYIKDALKIYKKLNTDDIYDIYNKDVYGLANIILEFIKHKYKNIYKQFEKEDITDMVYDSEIPPKEYNKNMEEFFDIVLESIKKENN